MKCFRLPLLVCVPALFVLGVQPKPVPGIEASTYSVLVYARMQQAGHFLDLCLAAKGKGRIRATLGHPPARITVFYRNGSVLLREDIRGKRSERRMTGEEAARQLMEMLALCPGYFFDEEGGLVFEAPVPQGYLIQLQQKNGGSSKIPVKLELIDKSTGYAIHSVRFLDFHDSRQPTRQRQPSRLVIANLKTGQKSILEIKRVEWNAGLPDFIFDPNDHRNEDPATMPPGS